MKYRHVKVTVFKKWNPRKCRIAYYVDAENVLFWHVDQLIGEPDDLTQQAFLSVGIMNNPLEMEIVEKKCRKHHDRLYNND